MRRLALLTLGAALSAAPARPAPETRGQLDQILKRAQQFQDIQITDEEEQQIGAAVSERVRARYGVVQDPAVHKYVSLVGTVLAQASSRPNIPYRFIVLDTDGVNAFAAPGGYVMITRGALGLIANEAELAGRAGARADSRHEQAHDQGHPEGQGSFRSAPTRRSRTSACSSRLVDVSTDMVLAGLRPRRGARVGSRRPAPGEQGRLRSARPRAPS